MVIKIYGNSFERVGTAISLPHDAEAEISDNLVIDSGKGLEVRDPPGLMHQLGFPIDTPPEYLIEALEALRRSTAPPPAKFEALKGSRLLSFLERGLGAAANIVSIGEKILPLLP